MVHETILSKMVKEFGDVVLETITTDLYSSGLAHLIIFVGGVAALLHLAIALQRGEAPVRSITFFCAWLACLPVGRKPLAYAAVNGIGTSLSLAIQKSANRILEGVSSSGRTMAPGWVMNALVRAATVEVSSPQLQDRILYLIENCIPNVANRRGDPLTAGDLFGGKISSSGSGGDVHIEEFDPSLLRARKLQIGGAERSCYDLLTETRSMLRSHLQGKDLTVMPEKVYVGASSGEPIASSQAKTTWSEPTTTESKVVKRVALNLATASAVQKAAMGYREPTASIPGPGAWLRNSLNDATHAQVSASLGSGSILSAITFDVMSTPLAVMRALKVDGAITSGVMLQEMNEKLLSLPYFIACVQNILKILAPIAVLTMLAGTFKIFFTWAFVWILTLLMPAVMNLSRAISNGILFQTNKLDEYANILNAEPGFLALGVDFSAANRIVEDSSRMMMTILSVEMAVWAALLLMVPAGAWFAGNLANNAVRVVGGGIVSGLSFGAGQTIYRGAARVTTKAIKPVASGAAAVGQRAMNGAWRSASYAYRAATFRDRSAALTSKPEANIKSQIEHMNKVVAVGRLQ